MNTTITTTRRARVLAGLILAVMIGTSIPASAVFSDSATVTTTVTTASVEPARALQLTNYCVTRTVTTKQTVSTDPVTGSQTVTYYNQSTSTATSTSNVQGTTTTSVAGPGPTEVTTTTVAKNTDVHVTLSWLASTSPRVTGYQVTAVAPTVGTSFVVAATTGTSVSQVRDADDLVYEPRLYVTTYTDYGWSTDSGRTERISC